MTRWRLIQNCCFLPPRAVFFLCRWRCNMRRPDGRSKINLVTRREAFENGALRLRTPPPSVWRGLGGEGGACRERRRRATRKKKNGNVAPPLRVGCSIWIRTSPPVFAGASLTRRPPRAEKGQPPGETCHYAPNMSELVGFLPPLPPPPVRAPTPPCPPPTHPSNLCLLLRLFLRKRTALPRFLPDLTQKKTPNRNRAEARCALPRSPSSAHRFSAPSSRVGGRFVRVKEPLQIRTPPFRFAGRQRNWQTGGRTV